MASRTTQIPRFLLPQSGPAWRAAAARSGVFSRTSPAEQAQVLVRYATTAASPKAASKTVTKTAAKTSTAKITTKAAPKATAAKTTAKAAPKTTTTKTAATTTTKTTASSSASKTASTARATKTTTTAAATPKTPASKPAIAPKPAAAKTTPASPLPFSPSPANPVKAAPADTTKPASAAPIAASTGSIPASLATDRAGPIILEKPDAFRPPSHGKRLPRDVPKHYGGGPTAEELQTQRTKQYPGMPPPESSWSHWFIHSKGIHLFITLGTLTGLTIYTFSANFQANSQFADMIPPISEFPRHPFQYMSVCIDVLKMHEEHESAITAEKRRQKIEDVAKRNEYRKAHGMEPASGVAPWAKGSQPKSAEELDGEAAQAKAWQAREFGTGTHDGQAAAAAGKAEAQGPTTFAETGEFTEEGKRKKFLGIF